MIKRRWSRRGHLMQSISYKRHRYPPDVIRYAVWAYFGFTMSFRDVEDLLAQRGLNVSYETVRAWTLKFGRQFARNIRRNRHKPTGRWHLDEVVVKICGAQMYLWRAIDDEGEVLDILVQRRRNTRAALKLLRKLLKNQGVHPEKIVTDGLGSYAAALMQLECANRHRRGLLRENNRIEGSHVPIRRRKRKSQGFKSQRSAQRFLSTHAAIYNLHNHQRHLISRRSFREFRDRAADFWAAATSAA